LGEQAKHEVFKRGVGCTHCNNTGYRGRIGVFELLEIDDAMGDALRRGDSADFARAAKNSRDYIPLTTNALDYARQGITSLEEVIRVTGEMGEVMETQNLTDTQETKEPETQDV